NANWNGYMKSGVVLQVIKGTNNTFQADLFTCDNRINYRYYENGFAAEVFFENYGLGLTVEVTLDGADLVVNVPEGSLIDNAGEAVYISAVSLFPLMGYTHLDDVDGYMLIPDGNGALIYLDDKEGRFSTGFSQLIYGKDQGMTESSSPSYLWDKYETVVSTDPVLAPVFGMAHTEEGEAYLAIVESGDKRASVEAHPNGVIVDYNRCFAKFLLRDVYIQPLNQSNSGTVSTVEADRSHDDLRVRYCFLSGEDADYSGMAVRYRNYLLANGLTPKDTSYKTRVDFLGSDRENFLVGTTAVTMTTTEDIQEIYSDLWDGGVDSVLSVYKGWQKGGIYNLPIKKYAADSAIGGSDGLTELVETAAGMNYRVYLYDDALRINAKTNSTTFDAVKKVNKRTLQEQPVKQVYNLFYYLMPSRIAEYMDKLISSAGRKGVDSFAIGGISSRLFSYSSRGSYYSRSDSAASITSAIAAADSKANLALETPFAWLWPYTEAALDMPLGSSDYMYVNEEIPFLSMVLKGILPMYSGYVNFEANKTEFFLQMVESGVFPSFYVTKENSSALIYTNSSDLYSTEYSTYRDTIVQYNRELAAVARLVEGAFIEDHVKLPEGVTKVTYSNGVVIYVNFSAAPVTVDGVTVEAFSYKAGETR
ncbi:MAG: DUF5696 domain-containing protein, partial [bacterium]